MALSVCVSHPCSNFEDKGFFRVSFKSFLNQIYNRFGAVDNQSMITWDLGECVAMETLIWGLCES